MKRHGLWAAVLACCLCAMALCEEAPPVQHTEPVLNSLPLFGLLAVAAAVAALAVRMVRGSH
jgi:hypothetical protein